MKVGEGRRTEGEGRAEVSAFSLGGIWSNYKAGGRRKRLKGA